MASSWMWRAAALTVLLNFLDGAASHFFWKHQWEKFQHLIPADLLPDEELELFDDVWTARFSTYSFYRGLMVEFIIQLIGYRWQIFLERLLPSRPRAQQQNPPASDQQAYVHIDHLQEEKIVQKLVAEGKIRRASISWCNIFLRWVLQITVGRALYSACWDVLPRIASVSLSLKALQRIPMNALQAIIPHLLLSSGPFTWLVSYVIIPARFRVPFVSLISLLLTLFISASLHIFLPWFVQTEFAHEMGKSWMLGANLAKEHNLANAVGEEFLLSAP